MRNPAIEHTISRRYAQKMVSNYVENAPFLVEMEKVCRKMSSPTGRKTASRGYCVDLGATVADLCAKTGVVCSFRRNVCVNLGAYIEYRLDARYLYMVFVSIEAQFTGNELGEANCN